jgi:hypothetical protein
VIKITHLRQKEEDENKLNFNGMAKFYGNILGKIKEKRDQHLAQKQQQEETMTVD